MVKLNAKQRRALKVLMPLNGTHHLLADLESEGTDLRGLSYDDVLLYADELEDMGLLALVHLPEPYGDGDTGMRMHSAGAGYFQDSKIEVAKSCLRFAGQLLTGACGGLAVFLLGRLLGA